MLVDQPPGTRVSTFPRRWVRLRRGCKWGSLAAALLLGGLTAASFFVEPWDWFVAGPAVAGPVEAQGTRYTREERHVMIGRGVLVYKWMSVYTWVEPFTRASSDINSHTLAVVTTFQPGYYSYGWGSALWPPAWEWGAVWRGQFSNVGVPLSWFVFPSLFAFLWLAKRDRRLSKHGYCLKCAYDTRGVPVENPCPECGGWERIA